MSRRHNPLRAQLHRSYTIGEIAALFDVTKTTVSHWIRDGLTPIDRKRPLIFQGEHLRAFMQARMAATKRPLKAGEIFCVACKRARVSVDSAVDLRIVSATSGDLVGRCPACTRTIYRRVKLANLARDIGSLTLTAQGP